MEIIRNQVAVARNLMQENKLLEANEVFLEVLRQDPKNFEVLYLLATSLSLLKEFQESLAYFNRAIAINSQTPQLFHNMGLTYQEMGDTREAFHCYQKALALNANYYQVYHKQANAYNSLGNFKLAYENFTKAFSIKPDYAEGWLDFGIFLSQREQFNEAKQCYENAIKFRPNLVKAYFHLGKLFFRGKSYQESMLCFQKALQLKSDYSESFVWLMLVADAICDWQDYQKRHEKLKTIYQDYLPRKMSFPFDPFGVLVYDWTPEMFANVAKRHSEKIAEEVKPLAATLNFKFSKNKKQRLKIAYISCGFNKHPTGQLAYNLFAYHDRSKFETFAFSHGVNDQSHYRQHFEKTAEHFIDIAGKSTADAAKIIYENEIDILIELDGYIQGSRMEIAALRPAPIQMCYLGFPGTTGATFMDYFIADKTVITSDTVATFQEKIITLPDSYQINNDQQVIADLVLTRKYYGLPEDAFIYCCFNQAYKIDPTVFSVWMDILRQVPKSVLWLFSASPLAEKNLQKEAENNKIDPNRIIFAKHEERSVHLARLQLADLFLDTLYYNAHTSASDALWAGVPVITYPGVNFPSRVAASLLKAVGLPEMIMPSLEAYRDRAIDLAEHPEQLNEIKQKLQSQKTTSALFNTKQFVRNLENAYLDVWQNLI